MEQTVAAVIDGHITACGGNNTDTWYQLLSPYIQAGEKGTVHGLQNVSPFMRGNG